MIKKIVIISALVSLMVSCSTESAEAPKVLEVAVVEYKTIDEVFEAVDDNYKDIENCLSKILKLDKQDVDAEKMVKEVEIQNSKLDELNLKIKKSSSSGNGYEKLKTAQLDYVRVAKEYFTFFKENASLLSKPDTKWTDDENDNFENVFYPLDGAFSDTKNRVEEALAIYEEENAK